MHIAIIGAGLAGLACATRLAAAGHAVKLFDKGRGPGGRMAARRIATPAGEAAFDHGAQYFTARDPGLRRAGANLVPGRPRRPLARRRPRRLGRHPRHERSLEAARRAPRRAMEHHGEGSTPRWRPLAPRRRRYRRPTLRHRTHRHPRRTSRPLLAAAKPDWSARAAATQAQPCWTVMAAFAARVPTDADVMKEQGPIGWSARNSAKPGRTGPEAWVIQAGPDWSKTHLEETPDAIVPQLMRAFTDRIGSALPPTLTASAHRWRYARSGKEGSGALWNPAQRLGVCGDWLLGPRVECAWLSGTRLADMIA